MENGELTKFAGRNLSACCFDKFPIPTVEQDEENVISIDAWAVPASEGEDHDSDHTEHPSEPVNIGRKYMKRTLTEKGKSNDENLPVKLIKIQQRKKWNPEEEASIVSEFFFPKSGRKICVELRFGHYII